MGILFIKMGLYRRKIDGWRDFLRFVGWVEFVKFFSFVFVGFFIVFFIVKNCR